METHFQVWSSKASRGINDAHGRPGRVTTERFGRPAFVGELNVPQGDSSTGIPGAAIEPHCHHIRRRPFDVPKLHLADLYP